jgi:hypothetical protein
MSGKQQGKISCSLPVTAYHTIPAELLLSGAAAQRCFQQELAAQQQVPALTACPPACMNPVRQGGWVSKGEHQEPFICHAEDARQVALFTRTVQPCWPQGTSLQHPAVRLGLSLGIAGMLGA